MASSIRIPKPRRLGLFALLLISWTSGVTFFILNTWISVEGEFGLEKHPWQFKVLKIHGGAAFLMMVAFGYFLGTHVPAGWKIRSLRPLGLSVVLAQGCLIVSAYLLYYLGDETLRQSAAYVHAFIGFSLPMLLVAHIRQGTLRRRKQRRTFPLAASPREW